MNILVGIYLVSTIISFCGFYKNVNNRLMDLILLPFIPIVNTAIAAIVVSALLGTPNE